MQRSPANRRPSQLNRIHHCSRRDVARSTNRPLNISDYGSLLFRWELIGNLPARYFNRRAQCLFNGEIVDFFDNPVNSIWQIIALGRVFIDIVLDFCFIMHDTIKFIDVKS